MALTVLHLLHSDLGNLQLYLNTTTKYFLAILVNSNTVTMYLNTFENTFMKNKKIICLQKNFANTVETIPKWLSIFENKT